MTLRDLLTAEVVLGGVVALVFLILYALRSNWRATPMGRNVMALMGVIGALMLLWGVHRLAGPLHPMVWVVGMGLLDLVLIWRVLLLWRAQHPNP